MPYEHALELLLEIVLLAMKSQPPEVSAEMWRRHMDLLDRADSVFKTLGKLKPFGGDSA